MTVQQFLVIGALVTLAGGALELAIRRAVASARRSFQWIVTEDDDLPELDQERLATFLTASFSPTLGWEPVPGSSGEDRAPGSLTRYSIDTEGARSAPEGVPEPTVAVFGDSYAFCRQVDDDRTWAAVLGRRAGIGVLNLGVGNYGVDQALLRYLERRRRLPEGVGTVLAVFVPETVCRVQSVWKHWMEFGNTFGFKPRFVLGSEGLELHPSPVRSADDFVRIERAVERAAELDPFLHRRFRRIQFRTSYLWSSLRAPLRHAVILTTVLTGRTADGELRQSAFDRAFAQVMRSNVREAHRAYRDADQTALLTAILERFRDEVEADGRRFIACVVPQLLDLARPQRADRTYRAYFANLAARMEVVDVTDDLLAGERSAMYVHDRYGGHLSVGGNEVVAERLAKVLG